MRTRSSQRSRHKWLAELGKVGASGAGDSRGLEAALCGDVGEAEGDEVGVRGADEGGHGGEAQGAELDGACGVGEDAWEAGVAGATALAVRASVWFVSVRKYRQRGTYGERRHSTPGAASEAVEKELLNKGRSTHPSGPALAWKQLSSEKQNVTSSSSRDSCGVFVNFTADVTSLSEGLTRVGPAAVKDARTRVKSVVEGPGTNAFLKSIVDKFRTAGW